VVLILFILTLGIAAFLPVNLIYIPPMVEYSASFFGGTSLQTHLSVTYTMHVLFTADGGFSVGNPVWVKVVMTGVNNSNFLTSYCCATVSNAVNIPPTKGSGVNGSNTIFDSRIYLTDEKNGSYIGSDWIRFTQPGGQNVTLATTPNLANPVRVINTITPLKNIPYPYNVSRPQSVIAVTDATGTNSIDSARFAARITLLLGAFSVVLLQPVLEAILLPEPRRAGQLQPPPPPPQGSPEPRTLSPSQQRRKENREAERQRKEMRHGLQESEATTE